MTHETYGITVEVEQDYDSTNPAKNWDMVGTMVLSDRCRYNFGHETADYETLQELANDPKHIVLPVYMYDHSGVTINTTGFSCPWDSGQVGVIYCTKEKAVYEFGKKLCTKKVREAAIRCMQGEVESVDDYLTGNVWGYRVLDADGEELDACWGFVGDEEYCRSEGESAAEWHIKQAAKEAGESAYWQEREVRTA